DGALRPDQLDRQDDRQDHRWDLRREPPAAGVAGVVLDALVEPPPPLPGPVEWDDEAGSVVGARGGTAPALAGAGPGAALWVQPRWPVPRPAPGGTDLTPVRPRGPEAGACPGGGPGGATADVRPGGEEAGGR